MRRKNEVRSEAGRAVGVGLALALTVEGRAVQVRLQYNFEHNILYSYCNHIVIIFNLYVMCINDVV
jgi:hypothetical protein